MLGTIWKVDSINKDGSIILKALTSTIVFKADSLEELNSFNPEIATEEEVQKAQ
jgi:hypothetical protein